MKIEDFMGAVDTEALQRGRNPSAVVTPYVTR